jgi:CubicO group peptidase (beta-lactamase class C family)
VVTLTDLANHTSGIPRMPSNFTSTVTNARNPYVNYSIENLYAFLAHLQLAREPGTQSEYSNAAVGLLGVILQKVYNTSYEALIVKYICDPLGMADTRVFIRKEDSARFAKGYNAGRQTSQWDLPPAFAGAGAIRSTARDLLIYAAANLGKAPSPLNKAIQLTHEVTFSNNTVTTGLNWFYLKSGGEKFLFHNGGTGGFKSWLGIHEKKQFAVVILSNSTAEPGEMGRELVKWLENN